jgi:hypothetical protein
MAGWALVTRAACQRDADGVKSGESVVRGRPSDLPGWAGAPPATGAGRRQAHQAIPPIPSYGDAPGSGSAAISTGAPPDQRQIVQGPFGSAG